jgi:cyclase
MKITKTILLSYVIFFVSVLSAFAQRREVQPVSFEKISDRLYYVTGGQGAASGVYIGDDSVLMIDAKMDEASQTEILKKIAAMTDKPIKYLVNTHSDGDHVSGNKYCPENVTIIAHEGCRAEMLLPGRNGGDSQWKDPELAPFVPSVTYTDGMTIYPGGQNITLSYYGIGHTTGDTVLYFEDENTAYIADMVMVGRPQLIHSYKGGNTIKYVETTAKLLRSVKADKFLTGHSGVITRTQIESQLETMKQRRAKVKSLMSQNKTLSQVQSEFEENESRLIETIYNELN